MMNDSNATPRSPLRFNRREFARRTAAAAAAFSVVPRHVIGGAGQAPPSERVRIAGIGIGGQGRSDLRQFRDNNDIVALCDVDDRHAAGTFQEYPKAKRYRDFRVMLEREKDIEAVVVATPDHLHAPVSIHAMRMGKHVYCEKPLTHTVHEARRMAEIARENKVATQMGNQGQASEHTRRICEFIWDGAIGPVREVHVWTDRHLRGVLGVYWPQGIDRPEGTPPVPDTLDWNLWLGPAPERPYNPAYLPFVWRGWWDFGTGALGDIGCHAMDPVFRALKLGHPMTVEACSSLVNEETYPNASMVTYRFPARDEMPPVSLTWYDGGLKPPRPEELEPGRQWDTNGVLFVGDKGKMLGNMIIPEAKRKAYQDPPKSLPRSPGHYQEWIDAIKGGKPAGSNFDWAGPLTEVVLLGNIAIRRSVKEAQTRAWLEWDGPNQKFTNLPKANEFITKPYREGWAI